MLASSLIGLGELDIYEQVIFATAPLELTLSFLPLLILISQFFHVSLDWDWKKNLSVLGLLIITTLLFFTMPTFRVWLLVGITWVTLLLMAPGKPLIISSIAALVTLLFFSLSPEFVKSAWTLENLISEQTKTILVTQAENIEQFFWFGQVHPLSGSNVFGNTYLSIISSFGFMGFGLYLAFNSWVIYQASSTLKVIPESFTWQRIMALTSFHFLLVFHFAGLFLNTLNHPTMVFMWLIATVTLLLTTEIYARGFVPDDKCL